MENKESLSASLGQKLGFPFEFTPPFSSSSSFQNDNQSLLAKNNSKKKNPVKPNVKKRKSRVKSLLQTAINFISSPEADRSVMIKFLSDDKNPPLSAPIVRKLLAAMVAARSHLLDESILNLLMKSFQQDFLLKFHGLHFVDNLFLEEKVSTISHLQILDLSKCYKVTSLDSIAENLGGTLKHLNVDSCKKLEDSGCMKLGLLKNLVYLKISGTKITEETMKQIGFLTQITTLDIRCNIFLSSGIQHLSNLALERLYVTECKFSPESIDCIRHFSDTLKLLEMSFVPHLNDEATTFLESMKKLEFLDISLTHSFGDLTLMRVADLPKLQKFIANKIDVPSVMAMEALGKNPSLKFLDLGKNDITDLTASKLNSLCTLTTLYLPYTRITDDFFILAPDVLQKVELLKLTGNRELTNIGVERLCRNARNLRSLDIGSPNLSDPCLLHLSTLHKLEELRIWNTAISENAITQFVNQNKFHVDATMRTTKGTYVLLRDPWDLPE